MDLNTMEIRQVDLESEENIKRYFKGLRLYDGFIRYGPKGYLFPRTRDIGHQMNAIYNMCIRPSDIFVATFPRSGTTWTQELVWLISNDLDYETAKSKHLIERYATLGSYFINVEEMASQLCKYQNPSPNGLKLIKRMMMPATELLKNTSEQRFIKCHIPLSMLPPQTLDICKMIYVARDPRSVAVSLYHLSRLTKTFEFVGDFKTFWDYFVKGLIVRSPYFEQVKEAWKRRDHPNMLFLFYEEMSKDFPATARKVSQFLGKNYTDVEVERLREHLDFHNFKLNKSVNLDFLEEFDALVPGEETFIRQGQTKGWHSYFDEEMRMQAENWIEDNLRDTDLKFPSVEET